MAIGDVVTPGVASCTAGAPNAASEPSSKPSPDLEKRAEEKRQFVQDMIRNLEQAIRNPNLPGERKYLQQIVNPDDPCFKTLINLMILPKYAGFAELRCVVLKAIQMVLKVAVSTLAAQSTQGLDSNIGIVVLEKLVGKDSKELADSGLKELHRIIDSMEQAMVACDAMLVLAELGPEAFEANGGSRVLRLLELFAALPDRASDLVEVALRLHAWGGKTRAALIETMVSHDGGRYLGEVLLQVINRGERMRRLRAVKLYMGCFAMPHGTDFLYTNDKRVLVEILMRELPSYKDAAEFVCYAECYRALVLQCEVALGHQKQVAIQLFGDLREDESCEREVREKCTEVLAALSCKP